MPRTVAEKRAAFRELHRAGCFVLPNPWDIGSARLFERLGFQALASTSSGYAWTTGRPDYGVTRPDALTHLAALCSAVDLPVNADYESGFAADPPGVAESVRLAIEAGVAGLSIEDRSPDGLYDKATALERLAAARSVAGDATLVARAEILLIDPTQVSAAIDKLVAFAPLADCLYAPGVRKPDDIRAMVAAVAPKPLNVLAMDPSVPVQAYADLGVRRISVGGSLARVGWGAVAAAAKDMLQGSFAGLASGMPGKELNAIFAPRRS